MKALSLLLVLGLLASCTTPPRVSEHKLNGANDEVAIRETLKDNMKHFQTCMDEGYRRNEIHIDGKIDMKFSVEKNGQIKSAKIQDGGIIPRSVNSCILGELRKIKFEGTPSKKIEFEQSLNIHAKPVNL